MNRTWTYRLVACLVGVLVGNLGPKAYVEFRQAETREWREKVAVKAIGDEIPLDVLRPIHRSKFSVAQVLALIETESKGNPRAKSGAGALGLMQVMGRHATERGYSVDDLYDPYVNVVVGLSVLEALAEQYGRSEIDYVSAWNCGPTKWDRARDAKEAPPGETITHWRRYRKTKRELDRWIEEGEWWE